MLLRHKCLMYPLVFIWAYTGIIIKRSARMVVHKDILFTAYAAIAVLAALIIITGMRLRKELKA